MVHRVPISPDHSEGTIFKTPNTDSTKTCDMYIG